jgi:hypothetical protein
VSRLPWLFALTLWPSGTTYGGGGRFVDKRKLIVRDNFRRPHPNHLPHGLELVEGTAEYHASLDEVEGADWSGYDHYGRLIYARVGGLYRRSRGRDRLIIDLNDRAPKPTAAPAWARQPITSRKVHRF